MSDIALQGAQGTMRISVTKIVSLSLEFLGRSLVEGILVWIAAAIFFTGSDLVDIIYGPGPKGHYFTPLIIASLVFRTIGMIVVPAAAWRVMLARKPVWAPDSDFWRYVLVLLGFNIVIAAIYFGAMHATRPLLSTASPAVVAYARYALHVVYSLVLVFVTVKLALWPVAKAIGDRAVGLVESWRRMSGLALVTFISLLIVIVPGLLVHVLLTALAEGAGYSALVTFWIVVADGLVTAVLVMAMVSPPAAIYRLAAERGAAPSADT